MDTCVHEVTMTLRTSRVKQDEFLCGLENRQTSLGEEPAAAEP